MTLQIKIKYSDDTQTRISKLNRAIGLICGQLKISQSKGEFKLIPLGVAMELPEGYEAHVVPRSSTYTFRYHSDKFNGSHWWSYKGDNDFWFFLHLRASGYRHFQGGADLPIQNRNAWWELIVNKLGNNDRGGLGSTARNKTEKDC